MCEGDSYVHIFLSETFIEPGDVLVVHIESSGTESDTIKIALDAAVLGGVAPILSPVAGSCDLPNAFTYVCIPDSTGLVEFSVSIPLTALQWATFDVTALLSKNAGELDCAIDSQTVLVVGPPPTTTTPVTASPTPTPHSCPCSAKQCQIPSALSAPCGVRNVASLGATCQAGRCVSDGLIGENDCISPQCNSTTPDGTACHSCKCACGAMVEGRLNVFDCEEPSSTSSPTPVSTTTTEETTESETTDVIPECGNGIVEGDEECDGGTSLIFYTCEADCTLSFFWPALLILLASIAVLCCCFFFVCFLARRRRRRRRNANERVPPAARRLRRE